MRVRWGTGSRRPHSEREECPCAASSRSPATRSPFIQTVSDAIAGYQSVGRSSGGFSVSSGCSNTRTRSAVSSCRSVWTLTRSGLRSIRVIRVWSMPIRRPSCAWVSPRALRKERR